MTQRNSHFKHKTLALCLIGPQVMVTGIFFIYPAFGALWQSLFQQDAFGLHKIFVGMAHYQGLVTDPRYLKSIWVTGVFSIGVTLVAMIPALLCALGVNRILIGKHVYRTLFIIPYAVAPAVAGLLWRFLFNPAVGVIPHALAGIGIDWHYVLNPKQAMLLVIIASAWQQFSFNFLFFLAGLQSIPTPLMDAARLDGASTWRRFWSITLPLLSPTLFFLVTMNLLFALFDTFGIIDVITQGGPGQATEIMVYQVYKDGFMGLDYGRSAAASVMLMAMVIAITALQFKYIEKRVHYV